MIFFVIRCVVVLLFAVIFSVVFRVAKRSACRFQSAIAYEMTKANAYTLDNVLTSGNLDAFETEDDVIQNLQEFNFANQVYRAMSDGYASEISARMSAMDNATKNAGELIGKLTIVYNRTRQAAITTELVDIITGASAL